MEVFLARIRQLLPVLGSEVLTPLVTKGEAGKDAVLLTYKVKGAIATGVRTPNGLVVFAGSTASKDLGKSVAQHGPWIAALRQKLIDSGELAVDGEYYRFTKDYEFASPSAAAAVICGRTAAGPISWKDANGKTLKEIEEEE